MHILNANLPRAFEWTGEQLLAFRTAHPFCAVRLDPRGRAIILPAKVGFLEVNSAILNLMLWDWHFHSGAAGQISDQPLPVAFHNGTSCKPDVTWTSPHRPKRATAPDFVMVLRKASESVRDLHRQMVRVMECGCRLSWLIDPYNRTVCIYRANGTGEMVEDFASSLSGEDVLPGLEIPLSLLIQDNPGLITLSLETQSN